jgi:hypothetical protein
VQLRAFIRPHLPDHIDFRMRGVSPAGRCRDLNVRTWLWSQRRSVVILARTIAYRLTPDEVGILRRRAIAVGVDHKDGDLNDVDLSLFDFHVSSSMTGARALEQILAEGQGHRRDAFVGLLFQGYDTRLANLRPRQTSRFAPIYVGADENAAIPESLRPAITTIAVTWNRDMMAALQRMPDFNFHFAVRPDAADSLLRRYKPFTKGANAAACFSNILINEQADDALAFLGRDYPYLLRSNTAAEVAEGFTRARDDFGGPEWRRGLDIMRAVRERVSGPALARQLTDIATRAAARTRQAAA